MLYSKKFLRVGLPAAALVAISTFVIATPGSHRHGTDILHFSVRKSMINEGVIANASGRVEANQNTQGNANNQRLKITMQNLEAGGTYQLQALVDDGTNYTQVAEFSSDSDGSAALDYRKVGSSDGKGKGKGLGHGKSQLPAVLDPLSDIRELAISMNSTQMVLRADLTSPAKLQYLIKRDLSTATVDATLRIKATTSQTQFRLLADGLTATNDYLLVLNGGIVQTNSADANGQLRIDSPLAVPTEILDLHSVALWDSASNVVLSTTLP